MRTKTKKLLLLIGPESSGTRVFAEILSGHPMILGTPQASEHYDVLDDVWKELGAGHIERARRAFPDLQEAEYVLTRRSMPHARAINEAARFMDFANLWGLHELCRRLGLDLVLLITTRSAAANLASWTINRASPGGSLKRAKEQYHAAYRYLFEFLIKSEVPFFFLSLEALLLDRQEYVQSVFQLLGLYPPQHIVELDIRAEVNWQRYAWYSEQGKYGSIC